MREVSSVDQCCDAAASREACTTCSIVPLPKPVRESVVYVCVRPGKRDSSDHGVQGCAGKRHGSANSFVTNEERCFSRRDATTGQNMVFRGKINVHEVAIRTDAKAGVTKKGQGSSKDGGKEHEGRTVAGWIVIRVVTVRTTADLQRTIFRRGTRVHTALCCGPYVRRM